MASCFLPEDGATLGFNERSSARGEELGSAKARSLDVIEDGLGVDVACGEPGEGALGAGDAGTVTILSAADGRVLRSLSAAQAAGNLEDLLAVIGNADNVAVVNSQTAIARSREFSR